MADGKGSTTVGAPPLAGSDWAQAEGPNRIIRIVLNGLAGPIDVEGAHYGTGVMVPFKDNFNDQEIAAVLTYVRQEWGNKAGPVKPEQVTAIRKESASKPDSWNRRRSVEYSRQITSAIPACYFTGFFLCARNQSYNSGLS